MSKVVPNLAPLGEDAADGFVHTNRCTCPVCVSPEKSTNPLILMGWYVTRDSKVTMDGVSWEGGRWLVPYTRQVEIKGKMVISSKGVCTSLDWNVDCQSWRKDVVPNGIEGRGWRALEEDKNDE